MRILIVGLGSIALKHIAAISRIGYDNQLWALRSGCSNNHVEGVTDITSLTELPESGVDFAIISNPTAGHASTISQLKQLQIPLFIEKPIFDSPAYDSLIHEINNSGLLTYVACNLRFLSCLQFIHRHLLDNPGHRINEVNVYCGSYLPEWRPGTDWRTCYSAIPELGGGVNIDLIHELDYVYWLFGAPQCSTGICRNVSSLDIRAIDYANYTLVYPGFTASIVLNYYRRDYRRTLEIVFDDATWLVDIAANTVSCTSTGQTLFHGDDNIANTYTAQMAYFMNLVRQHASRSFNDAATAYEILKIANRYERPDR